MADDQIEAHLRFLRECSRISLGDFFLHRLAMDQQLRKSIGEGMCRLLNEAIDNAALIRLAEILRDYPDIFPRADLVSLARRTKSKR